MNKKDRLKIVDSLGQLLNGDIPNEGAGLCYNVEAITSISRKSIEKHFETWKHYSGDVCFPVPSANKRKSPSSAYLGMHNQWIGKYGELRKDLCRHIIKELKKEKKRRAKK